MIEDLNLHIQNRAMSLTQGARLALSKMGEEFQRATTMTFNGNGAYFLFRNFPELCEMEHREGRDSVRRTRKFCYYRLTPLGMKVKQALKRKGFS